jgi:hypothetical protein
MLKNRHEIKVVSTFILILSLGGCALIGGYSAKSHEHVTAIKAAHIKFIDTFTEGDGKSWDLKRFADESDKIDLKFREALEFSKSLDDKFRTSNIQALKEIFEIDQSYIKSKKRMLTKVEADTQSEPSKQAYDRVIDGECARPSAVCK